MERQASETSKSSSTSKRENGLEMADHICRRSDVKHYKHQTQRMHIDWAKLHKLLGRCFSLLMNDCMQETASSKHLNSRQFYVCLLIEASRHIEFEPSFWKILFTVPKPMMTVVPFALHSKALISSWAHNYHNLPNSMTSMSNIHFMTSFQLYRYTFTDCFVENLCWCVQDVRLPKHGYT